MEAEQQSTARSEKRTATQLSVLLLNVHAAACVVAALGLGARGVGSAIGFSSAVFLTLLGAVTFALPRTARIIVPPLLLAFAIVASAILVHLELTWVSLSGVLVGVTLVMATSVSILLLGGSRAWTRLAALGLAALEVFLIVGLIAYSPRYQSDYADRVAHLAGSIHEAIVADRLARALDGIELPPAAMHRADGAQPARVTAPILRVTGAAAVIDGLPGQPQDQQNLWTRFLAAVAPQSAQSSAYLAIDAQATTAFVLPYLKPLLDRDLLLIVDPGRFVAGDASREAAHAPAGARLFAHRLSKVPVQDTSGRAKLLSAELRHRAAPCRSLDEPLSAWRAQSQRTAVDLASVLSSGLAGCPLVGVDVEALEYIVATPFPKLEKPRFVRAHLTAVMLAELERRRGERADAVYEVLLAR